MIPALIAAGAALAGGAIKAASAQHQANQEYERQKEFARNGIRWKVEDAKAAGLHPLYAIGAQGASYTPQSTAGVDYGLESAGQNISRAIEAKQTEAERQEDRASQKEYLSAQSEKLRAEAALARQQTAYQEAEMYEMMHRNEQTQVPPAMPRSVGASAQGDLNKIGDFDAFEQVGAYRHADDPEVVDLMSHPDFKQITEDIPIVEFAPVLVGFNAHNFTGRYEDYHLKLPLRRVRGLVYSRFHKGFIDPNNNRLMSELRKYLIDQQLMLQKTLDNFKKRHNTGFGIM